MFFILRVFIYNIIICRPGNFHKWFVVCNIHRNTLYSRLFPFSFETSFTLSVVHKRSKASQICCTTFRLHVENDFCVAVFFFFFCMYISSTRAYYVDAMSMHTFICPVSISSKISTREKHEARIRR